MNLLISKLLHWFLYSGTFFLAAGAVAEPAAAASSPAPAAAPAVEPSSSSSQPAAEPAAAPAAEPSIHDIVREAAIDAEKDILANKAPQLDPETKPAVAETKPAVVDPAKPAAETKPAEGETKPAAATPNPLDKIGPLPAEKITAALAEAPPEVQQYLKDKGLSVEALSENARLAAQTSQFLEKVPSIEALDVALQGNANFQKLETGLPAVQDAAGFNKFMMDVLVPMSFLYDENGKPIPDPNNPGAFKNDGSIAKLIDFSAAVRDTKLMELADIMLQSAKTDEDRSFATDLKGAAEFVGNFIKNGYKMPGAKTEAANLPKDVQERLDRADRIERESREREQNTQRQSLEHKEDRIITGTEKVIQPVIQSFLDKSALSPKLKTLVAETVWSRLVDQMAKDTLYNQQRDLLSPNAPDYEQRRVALNKQYMTERVVKILEEVVGQIGGPIVDANKARHEKIDSQSTASRMDPKTSGTTPQSFPAAPTSDQFHAKAMEIARAENPAAKEGGTEYWKAVLKMDTP